MDESPHFVYEFSGFRADPVRRMLFGPDGEPIHLKPKVFNTLLYFVEHPHELLEKQTLLEAIWPHVVVEENNLSQAVSTLRRVLGEHPTDHRFIITEPGRGYRFAAAVTQHAAGREAVTPVDGQGDPLARAPEFAAPATAVGPAVSTRLAKAGLTLSGRWLAGILLTVVLLVVAAGLLLMPGQKDLRSVAVMPFENLNPDGEHALFVRALHDDVLTQLGKVGALKVISRTSLLTYEEPARDLRDIGRQLGVATILEGSVQRTDDTLHMNIRLLDADTGELLWTEIYDREPTAGNIFATQSDIVRRVAETLDATLTPGELARLDRPPTQNTKAYEFYVSGRVYYRGSDLLRDLPAAAQQFERAVEEDPQFALAHAYLSITSSHMYWTMDRSDARQDLAKSAAQAALSLQPDLPDAHLAMAWYHYQGRLDYEAALKELAIAEQGMPGHADLLFARGAVYRRMGRWQQAVATWERAIELDPRNANLLRNHSSSYRMLRNFAQAEYYLDRVLEIAPDAVEAKVAKAAIPLDRDGDGTALLQAIDGNPMLRPGQEILDKWFIAMRARDYDTAIGQLDEWQDDLVYSSRTLYKLKAAAYGITYRLAGQPELARQYFATARTQLEAALAENPDQPRLLISLGEVLVGLGQPEAGARLALRAIELMPTSREAMDGPTYQVDAITRVLAPAGATDVVLEQLDAYLAAPGFWSIEGLLPDPRLDPIRDDPRFEELVKKYRRP
jgi:TolB-like protein/DNA-binding winged helix-turn-helix (wHTH) protein/tetratricopeptide (TPR) repeat protein